MADIKFREKLNSIITELFTKGRQHRNWPVFFFLSYFTVPKIRRLGATLNFKMKIPVEENSSK